ncbi:MAG: hypothetical protein L6455_14655 [Kiritimatiellae bacterium]|nr:hypothetical protein [Kiritimatiellia bacterium]
MSVNLYWSLGEQKLVSSLNSTTKIERYDFVLRDTLPVVLRVCNEQSNINVPYIVTAIDAGSAIKFGAKALATYATDADFLFNQATWVAAVSGTSTTYTADIPLNTAELIAAMGTAPYLDCKVEFTIYNTALFTNALSTQLTFRIYKDVITGSEGVPTSTYPVVSQILDDTGAQIVKVINANGVLVGVFKNGAPYVFILSTGLWYPLTGIIQDGIPVPAFGAGETF